MGPLDGGLREQFHDAFSGLYLDGTLTRISKTVDRDGEVSDSPAAEPIKLHRNPIGEIVRQEFADIDICVIVLRHGVSDITTDDEIEFEGVIYAVRRTQSDPAGIYWKVWGERMSNDG